MSKLERRNLQSMGGRSADRVTVGTPKLNAVGKNNIPHHSRPIDRGFPTHQIVPPAAMARACRPRTRSREPATKAARLRRPQTSCTANALPAPPHRNHGHMHTKSKNFHTYGGKVPPSNGPLPRVIRSKEVECSQGHPLWPAPGHRYTESRALPC